MKINPFTYTFIFETLLLFTGAVQVTFNTMIFYVITFLAALIKFGWDLTQEKKES